jgi:4-amino-4-deoxy-L-arabinose transferase-like glycosyltransferase
MEYLKKHKYLLLILFIAFVLRVINIQIPIVEGMNATTRQALTAMVARNFAQKDFNLLWPRLDNNGKGIDLYAVEAPVYPALCALAYKAIGVHEWAARLVSVAFSLGTLVLLFLLFSRYFGEQIAVISALVFALSPMSIALGRSVQPESAMVFFSVGAIYCIAKWLDTKKNIFYFLSLLLFLLAVVTKPYTLYLLLPILYFMYERQGRRSFWDYKTWLFCLSSFVPLAWYYYMYKLTKIYPVIYSVYTGNQQFVSFSNIFTKAFVVNIPQTIVFSLITPVGAVLLLLGLSARNKKEESKFVYFWLLALLIYIVGFSGPNMNHPYYQYPLTPVLAYFVARGARLVAKSDLLSFTYLKNKYGLALLTLLLLLSVAVPYRYIYTVPKESKSLVEAGRAVDRLTPKASLVIASYSSGPVFLYYCNRKGWDFLIHLEVLGEAYKKQGAILPPDVNLDPIKELEKLRGQGAQYFASANMEEFSTRQDFAAYLYKHYKIVEEKPNEFILFDLTRKRG